MDNCCHNKQNELEKTATRHKRVLWTVLFINLGMFFIEISFGVIADSLALIGDSLDMLGDAITYGSSILVIGMSTVKKANVAKLKAWVMMIFGLAIALKCFYRVFFPGVPNSQIMLLIGLIALFANIVCLILLTRHRDDDINMKSVWVCSRNDIIANVSVLGAAGLVYISNSFIPDLVVGIGLTFLFIKSAFGIFKDVERTLRDQSIKIAP